MPEISPFVRVLVAGVMLALGVIGMVLVALMQDRDPHFHGERPRTWADYDAVADERRARLRRAQRWRRLRAKFWVS